MNNFLGTQEERPEMIAYCENKFRAKFGRNFAFSPVQKGLLMDVQKSVAMLDCVAGAGKTTLLLSIAMWFIRRKKVEKTEGILHYVTETQELADDFHQRLVVLEGSDEGIFPLGFVGHASERRSCVSREYLDIDVYLAICMSMPILSIFYTYMYT